MAKRPSLLFEAIPPPQGRPSGPLLEKLSGLRQVPLDGVLVPEILDGEYRTADPVAFAADLGAHLGAAAFVNQITVDHTAARLQERAFFARGKGVQGFVLVGPSSSGHRFPGVGVEEGLRALRGQGALGVVTIPGRDRPGLSEAQRLVRKRLAGADFSVSQVILDPGPASRLLEDVIEQCRRNDVAPPRIYWTLAPFGSRRDLDLLAKLGVRIPERAVSLVQAGDSSLQFNLDATHSLTEKAERCGAKVGFCVSHLTLRNITAAVELARAISKGAPQLTLAI